MSRCLTERSIEHVLLERGEVASSWRTERWDSLRLLTPNWLSRLPGWRYRGNDPDGYMTAGEVADYLAGYGEAIAAPVASGTTVASVAATGSGFVVATDRGRWHGRAVVIATGACSSPHVPASGGGLPARIAQLSPITYRNPAQLGPGGVLVVGASASGAQIADELQRSGRRVTLAVGEHTRLPRSYRGRDIHWWMDRIGLLDERYDEMDDIVRARRLPSLQLIGSPERRTLDLNALSAAGVQLVGRLVAIGGGRARFSGSLANTCASADLKQGRLLDQIDTYAADHGLEPQIERPDRPRPTEVPTPVNEIALATFDTVIWATGFRPRYPWLEPHLLDRKGQLVHDGGVMAQPGMYVLGLPFTRRRKSSFLDGVGPDARDLSTHLARHLARPRSQLVIRDQPRLTSTQP